MVMHEQNITCRKTCLDGTICMSRPLFVGSCLQVVCWAVTTLTNGFLNVSGGGSKPQSSVCGRGMDIFGTKYFVQCLKGIFFCHYLSRPSPQGEGILPYMGYIGMYTPKGYGFSAVLVNRILAIFGLQKSMVYAP